VRILVTSLSDESGKIGTATLPNATAEKNATVQFGIFWERIATLAPALIPNRESIMDKESHFFLKVA
jgi:hypothetical protein